MRMLTEGEAQTAKYLLRDRQQVIPTDTAEGDALLDELLHLEARGLATHRVRLTEAGEEFWRFDLTDAGRTAIACYDAARKAGCRS